MGRREIESARNTDVEVVNEGGGEMSDKILDDLIFCKHWASQLEFNADQAEDYLRRMQEMASKTYNIINQVQEIYLLKREEYFAEFKRRLVDIDLNEGDR